MQAELEIYKFAQNFGKNLKHDIKMSKMKQKNSQKSL